MTVKEAGANLSDILLGVSEGHRACCILGEHTQGVLISMEDWNAIQESLCLNSFPGLADSIVEGMCVPVSECATDLAW